MPIYHITTIHHPALAPYARLTEAQLRHQVCQPQGLFIAESPKVIKVALEHGMQPMSMLCEERHISGDAASIIASQPSMPVYTGSRHLLAQLTGYTLTRGVLCAMRRPELPTLAQICSHASRVAVIHGVVDTTNIGAIFRSAAALGIDAVILTPNSCDPLNRRSIRVSMGSVFMVPWTWADHPLQQLHTMGFTTIAMALTQQALPLCHPSLKAHGRLAIILGTEGDGLPQQAIADACHVARIPMAHGVDSLNVAAAAAVAFWELRPTAHNHT